MSEIIGHGGGKSGSSHKHYEAPDSLHNTSYARVLDLVSEGEILGLAKGLESVYLNQTPIENANGTRNFASVSVDLRAGTQDQDYIPGFADVENEISVGVELRSGTPWVRAINNTELSAVRITLGVPALSKADTSNGDILGYKVEYRVELSKDGGTYQTVISSSFSGKTTSAYQRSARVDLPRATTGWQIRVVRVTPNANTTAIADSTMIVSFTEIIDAKLRYPMSAIVGVQVDAKEFQSVPTRAYDLFGRIIQVPSNYDPITRAYTGVWDGTFKPAWSSNPAWVFRDLVLHERYGLGDRIAAAQLDKWSLYRIAQYCDQMVPNGKGGMEPRFTCNLYLQSQKAAYAVLQDIASIFRGISYWGGGAVIASADMPADPTYVYTAANVIDGKFTRAGSGKATRYTVALVTWNDPEDFYKQKVEYVEDSEGIKRYGIQQATLTAFGCTSQSQAQRAGRWVLATSRLETEALSFDVGLDGAIALPGQIVRVADPARMGRRVGGRIHSAAGRTVVLDKAPIVKAGDNLTVILPSGKSETRAVASVSGDSVTVTTAWSTLPLAQSVWSVDSTALSAPLFRVLSVTEKDEVTYTITAIQHEPGKFDFVENGTAITPRTQTALDVTRQEPPAAVTLVGYTVSLNDVQKLALQVSCAPVGGAVAYEGAYRRGDDNWVAIPRQPSPTIDVLDVLPGTYMAKMSAVNAIGVTSIETLSVAVEIAKDGVSKNADILLDADSRSFYTNQAGQTSPTLLNISATLIALDGPVSWSIVGGTLTSKTATTAQLTFANMPGASAEVTASVTAYGRTYTKSIKIGKLKDGAAGADGLKTAIARLFKWAPLTPVKPAGVSTFTWAALTNTGYTGQDGWANPAPANPGTPGWRLFTAAVPLSAAAAATTTPVSYTGATIEDGPQNGGNGASGLQFGEAVVYLWAATIPAGPVGDAMLVWADGTFGAAPESWALTPGTSPSPGYTLWKAAVRIVDTAGVVSTSFNWTSASISAVGSAGTNGQAGVAMYVDISTAGGQVFSRADSTAVFTPTSITLTATPYGGAASSYQWQYWTGSTWTNISGATAAATSVASGAFTGSRVFRVRATIAGVVYTDEVTLVQVTGGKDGLAGADAITGFLTNESITLAASNAGVVASFASAVGTFKIFEGVTDKTGTAVAYSVFSQTGCDVSITTAGAYSVASMSADQGTATLQAVYRGVTIQKVLTLAKARAGTSIVGAEGASYVTAYCASATASTSTAPAPTAGKSSVPAVNSGGLVGAYTKTVPTLTAGQFMYQVDGIYNPANDTVTWSVPYWSSLKVGSLSAITLGVMGAITSGSMDIGTGTTSWHVDASGNQWAGAATYAAAPFRVSNAGAMVARNLLLQSPTGENIVTPDGLQPGFEAPGTKNSELVPSIAAAATTAGWDGISDIPYQSILNNDDSVALGFNPSFSDWTGSYPAGWSNAATSNLPVKETTIKRLGKWSMKYVGNGSTNMGITKAFEFKNSSGVFEPLPDGTFLSGTIDMYLANVVSGLPQVIVRLYHSSVMGAPYTDLPVKPQATADMWQRVQFKHKLAAGLRIHAIRFYFFGSYSGNGGHYNGTVYFDNFRFALFDSSLDNTAISIGADGRLGGAGGGQVTINGLGYNGALDATKGAPAGTMVGGTEAGLVASRALNGDTALAAVNNATSGLASKLAAAGNQNLTGPVALTSNGAIVVGTVNDGVRINTGGIIGRKAGFTTFSIAADGTAVFGGTLTAASGTLGSLRLPPGGGIMSGSYTGYDWPASGQTGCYYGPEGILLGNARDGKFVQFDSNGTMLAPGFQLINGQLTLTSTVIISPRISQPVLDSFAYTVAGGGSVSGPNGTLGNSVTLTVSGNNGPHKIVWSFARLPGGLPSAPVWMSTGDGGRTGGVNATASNTTINVQVSAVITGADGRTLNYSENLSLTFGTG